MPFRGVVAAAMSQPTRHRRRGVPAQLERFTLKRHCSPGILRTPTTTSLRGALTLSVVIFGTAVAVEVVAVVAAAVVAGVVVAVAGLIAGGGGGGGAWDRQGSSSCRLRGCSCSGLENGSGSVLLGVMCMVRHSSRRTDRWPHV